MRSVEASLAQNSFKFICFCPFLKRREGFSGRETERGAEGRAEEEMQDCAELSTFSSYVSRIHGTHTQRQRGDAFTATPVSWLNLSPPLIKHLSFKTMKLLSGWRTTNYQHSCWFNWAAFPGISFWLQDCTKSSLVPAAFLKPQGENCHFT